MPTVGGKKFSYSKKGKAAAKAYAKRTGKSMSKRGKESPGPRSQCPTGYVQLPNGSCAKKGRVDRAKIKGAGSSPRSGGPGGGMKGRQRAGKAKRGSRRARGGY